MSSQKGYDEVAQDYLERYASSAARAVWLDEAVSALPTTEAAHVLDLGCGTGPAGDWQGNWLGADMFFSQCDAATSLSLVEQAGLKVSRAETMAQDDEDASFLWVIARKPP